MLKTILWRVIGGVATLIATAAGLQVASRSLSGHPFQRFTRIQPMGR